MSNSWTNFTFKYWYKCTTERIFSFKWWVFGSTTVVMSWSTPVPLFEQPSLLWWQTLSLSWHLVKTVITWSRVIKLLFPSRLFHVECHTFPLQPTCSSCWGLQLQWPRKSILKSWTVCIFLLVWNGLVTTPFSLSSALTRNLDLLCKVIELIRSTIILMEN